jgi:hypothetical protein
MSNSAGKPGESTSQVREHWYSFDFQDHARMHFLETPCSDASNNSNGHNRSGSEIHASRSHTIQGEAARTACDGQVRHEARDVASSPQRRLFDESIDTGEGASRSPEIELKELERAWNLVRLEHSSMMASLAPKQLPQQHATNAGNTSPLQQHGVAGNEASPLSVAKAGSARTPVSVATPERSGLALLLTY